MYVDKGNTKDEILTRLVNVRQHTTTGNSGANETVQFLVTTDRELKMARSDTFDSQILGCVPCS